MKYLLFFLSFFLIPIAMTAQEYGSDIPGADSYSGQCRISYINSYRDGKACANGFKSSCGIIQPTVHPECSQAMIDGYATGYQDAIIKKASAPIGPKPKKCSSWDYLTGNNDCSVISDVL